MLWSASQLVITALFGLILILIKLLKSHKHPRNIRDFAHGDYEAFNAYLQGINWYEVFTEATIVNSRWVAFTSIINAGISACIPLKIAGNNLELVITSIPLMFVLLCAKREKMVKISKRW